jgi:CBS domain containing-hemolysin-like protein
MDLIGPLALILACLAASAFFSGSETALLRLRQHELEEDVEEAEGPASLAAQSLLKSTSRLLVTILLGNSVVNILGAAVASALAIKYLGEQLGILAATAVMTVLVLVLAEVLPKAVAARYPRGVAYAVSLPLYLLHQGLRPIHLLFDRAIEPFVRWITGGRAGEARPTSEELLRLARSARELAPQGTPLAIMAAAGHAAEMTVEEIMVPRTEVVAFPIETPPAELLEKILRERYTRVPIYEGSIDRVRGLVHMKDLVKHVREEGGDLLPILKPVLRVPERKPILNLLADMQRAFVHLAIVKDEFDVTLGIVTQEDVLEELVGEIRDEFDSEELLAIRHLPDGSYRAFGREKVRDFNRESGWEVPSEPGDTLSGLVFNALGRAPRHGDVTQVAGYDIYVADMSGNRVTEVRVVQRPEAEQPEAAEG